MRSVEVYTKDVYDLCKTGNNCRDIGEHYLGGMIKDDEDIDEITGDGGFAMRIFENALDWTVGIYIVKLSKAILDKRKWYRFRLENEGRKWYRTGVKSGQRIDITNMIET